MPFGIGPGEKRPAHWKPTGFPAVTGYRIARTWAIVHGSAWLLASDLVEPPGIFCHYKNWRYVKRRLESVDIYPEAIPSGQKNAKLYRLSPELVKSLLATGRPPRDDI